MAETTEQQDGPWRAKDQGKVAILRKEGSTTYAASFWCGGKHGYPTFAAAMEAAEAEAARLNRKWREEQQAREREAEKARRVEAFVKWCEDHLYPSWFWDAKERSEGGYYVNDEGEAFCAHNGANFVEGVTTFIPRAELESALKAAGVEPPVELSEELVARLEERLKNWMDVYVRASGFDPDECTPAQAAAFLRKKGIEVTT